MNYTCLSFLCSSLARLILIILIHCTVGNSHWRMLVAANKQLYITLPKRQKMLLSRSIVNAVRSQNPPGRFLQKNGKTKLWVDVGDQRAQEKTSHAMRDVIRNKVTANTTLASSSTSSTSQQQLVSATVDVATIAQREHEQVTPGVAGIGGSAAKVTTAVMAA